MPNRRSRAFCKALHQEIGDDPQRWTTITAVAERLDIDQAEFTTDKPRPIRKGSARVTKAVLCPLPLVPFAASGPQHP